MITDPMPFWEWVRILIVWTAVLALICIVVADIIGRATAKPRPKYKIKITPVVTTKKKVQPVDPTVNRSM